MEVKIRKLTTEAFIEKAQKRFGSWFDYSFVDYTVYSGPVTILCPLHGCKSIRPDVHLRPTSSGGCKECADECTRRARAGSLESFIAASKAVHGDCYDYSVTKYTVSHVKVDVICRTHGIFRVAPNNHINRKSGCPHCAESGYKITLPATLCILGYSNVLKIGITNRDVVRRCGEIRRGAGKPYKVVSEYRLDGQIALNIETKMLHELKAMYKQPSEVYQGSTEAFLDVDLLQLKTRIESLISEKTTSL